MSPRALRTAALPALCLGLLSASVAFAAIAYFPGDYTFDSMQQLAQARTGVYNDHFPPVMAGLWAALIGLTGSYASLFLVQLLVLEIGLCLWGLLFIRARLWLGVIALTIFAWSPFLMNFSGTIWKDVGMAFALLTAFALVARGVVAGSLSWQALLLAAPLSFYACAVRHNALPALVPLVLLALWFKSRGSPRRRSIVAAIGTVGVLVGFVAAEQFVSTQLLEARPMYMGQLIAIYDMAGISVLSGKDVLPQSTKTANYSWERLQTTYRPESVDYLFMDPPLLRPTRVGGEVATLLEEWLRVVTRDPVNYLRHRWLVFAALLRIGESTPFFIWVDPRQSDDELRNANEHVSRFAVSAPALRLIDGLRAAAERYTPGFFGWFWVCLLVADLAVALFLCRAQRFRPPAIIAAGLAISGLCYALPYFFVSMSSDFRYLYWSIIAAAISSSIILGIAGTGASALLRQNADV